MAITDEEVRRLFEAHRRRLFGHAWQLTGNVGEAEDAVQEVFLRVLRTRDRYQERGRAAAWLLRILVNLVRERGRRNRFYQGRVLAGLEAAAGDGSDPAASPERRAASSQALQRALRALGQAPPALREVLVLRQFEERSTSEIAEILGVAEATVRTRLKRARDLVLRLCEADGEGGEDD